MKLSVIVASRNDDHGEFLTERTNLFIDTLMRQAKKYNLDGELIIVEWNPPTDRKPLSEELTWPPASSQFPISVITVPRELHKKFRSSDKLPFFQMIAKNVGARRARGDFLLFTNVDVLFSDEMVRYLASAKLDNRKMYRANRHDTAALPSMYLPVEERLALCKDETFKIWKQQANNELHTIACGDFTLVENEVFIGARGYCEFEGFSVHIDGVLCHRLVDVFGRKQKTLQYPIYHIDHKDKYGRKLLDEIRGKGIPLLINYKKIAKMPHSEKWGFADETLREWQPPTNGQRAPGLTIFTCPKSYRGKYRTAQLNALQSWLRLKPTPEVILIGDEPDMAEMARDFRVRHLPDIECNEQGTPLVSSLWRQAERYGAHRVLCYVNADIVLLQDWLDAVLSIQLPEFLAVGRRWDWQSPRRIDFAEGWDKSLMRTVKGRKENLHVPAGVDYFAFTRGLYKEMPPFAVGRVAWDNWLTNHPLTQGLPLVDITADATAIHQNHTYGIDGELNTRDIWESEEAEINRKLSGFYWATIDQATYRLESGELKYNKTAPFTNLTFLPKAYKPESKETVEVGEKRYPAYLNKGNAKQFIVHMATRYCIGKGLDVGAGRWPIKLHHGIATPVDFGQKINDGVTLPGVEPDSQDFIFSSHCLEHLTEWKAALHRWLEVLRPGGRLFLFLPHPSFKPWNPGGAWVSGHMWKPEHDSLCAFLRKVGFVIEGSNPGPDTYQSFHVAARKPCTEQALVMKRGGWAVVVPVRNSNKQEIQRITRFVKRVAATALERDLSGELILVEWNPPQKRKRIADVLQWPAQNTAFPMRVISVSDRYHASIYSDLKRDIYAYLALNIGAARAESDKLVLLHGAQQTEIFETCLKYIPTPCDAYWLSNNALVIRRDVFAKIRGFTEVAQEENQICWLSRVLENANVTLRDADKTRIKLEPQPLQDKRAEAERTATEAYYKNIERKGFNWGMRYDPLRETNPHAPSDQLASPRRIAFVLTGGIGDMLEGIPTVKALAKKYPEAQIDWITHTLCVPLVPMRYVRAVSVPFTREIDQFRAWLEKNSSKYDQIHIAMGIHRRIICAHYTTHMMNLIAIWSGVTLTDRSIDVDVERINVDRFKLPEKYVVVCTSPCYSCNQWPMKDRQSIANRFEGKGYSVVLVGGRDGKNLSGDKMINLCGKLTYTELIAVVDGAELYIGPDTGPTWLACAAKHTPKFCVLPGRVQIPTGFEGYTTGTIKDVTYRMPVEEYAEKAVEFLEQNPKKRPARRKTKKRTTIDVALIVLNGEPWLDAWIKTYRDFADNLIVVEGVDADRFKTVPEHIKRKCFTDKGHSLDNTLDILNEADANMTLVTKENGFWPDKNAMFAELSKYVNADYLFEIDGDEFWYQKDLATIRALLEREPEIATWWGTPLNFWRGPDWHSHGVKGQGLWWNDGPALFKWQPGMTLIHRPRHTEPPINDKTAYLPFKFHHYNYVLAKDAKYKRYYHKESTTWFEEVWLAWSPENRLDLTRGIQPGKQKKTHLVEFKGKHPKFAAEVLTRLEKGV